MTARTTLPRLILLAALPAVLLAGCGRSAPPLGSGLRADGGGPKPVMAASGSSASLQSEDFVAKAVGADLYAIQAARIATRRAHAPQVKAFAEAMAAQHAADRVQLVQAAARAGQPLPKGPTERQQALLDLLNRDTSEHFDRTYVEQQAMMQEDTLGAMQAYAKTGSAPAIRTAALDLQPATDARLQQARALEDELNKP